MTVIRLLNNQAATKEDRKFFSRNADNGSSGNLHINQQGQGNGQCQKKPNTVTQQRKATETAGAPNDNFRKISVRKTI